MNDTITTTPSSSPLTYYDHGFATTSNYYTDSNFNLTNFNFQTSAFPTPPSTPYRQSDEYSYNINSDLYAFNYSSFHHCQKMTNALEKLRNHQSRFEPYADSRAHHNTPRKNTNSKRLRLSADQQRNQDKKAASAASSASSSTTSAAAILAPAKSSSCEEICLSDFDSISQRRGNSDLNSGCSGGGGGSSVPNDAFSFKDISVTIESIQEKEEDEKERDFDEEFGNELTFLLEKNLLVKEQEDEFMPYIC